MSRSATLLLVCFALPWAGAGEPVDLVAVSAIREEAFKRSQVMDVLTHLTEVIGPRLTGSPAMLEANKWTRDKMAEWGMDGKVEAWGEFGRGWSFSRVSIHMLAPRQFPLLALPSAWTPGTDGAVTGTVMILELNSKEDLENYRDKLAGKILLLADTADIETGEEPEFKRHDPTTLEELQQYEISKGRGNSWRKRIMRRIMLSRARNQFFRDENVLAILKPSSFSGGVIRAHRGGSHNPDDPIGIPELVLTSEHYNHLHRLVSAGTEVSLELDVTARFHQDDLQGYNTIAEIRGSDKADEVVMMGAHLDSWHGGTGATDNAAGVVVMMEAARIIAALDLKPRRTIRVALWSGEEQGLLGSRGYVSKHFAERKEDPAAQTDDNLPTFLRQSNGPLIFKPEHEKFSAYFNLDNGAGKIRGIYAQGNVAAAPIFQAWLEPFADLGATTVTLRNTGSTDHIPFDSVGLPGFQFIQDALAYGTHTHHSNMDVLDKIVAEDLMQASAIMASIAYHAAMREERLPRKPLPPEK